MNIEQLAIEPCGGCGNSNQEKRCIGCLHDFGAKAYQAQEGEAVALPTFNEISKNIDDSRFVGHPKQSALDTNNVKTGARIMYDAIYVWLKKQNSSSQARIEKLEAEVKRIDVIRIKSAETNIRLLNDNADLQATNKKLLDALKDSNVWLTVEGIYPHQVSVNEQAIAEAEAKA